MLVEYGDVPSVNRRCDCLALVLFPPDVDNSRNVKRLTRVDSSDKRGEEGMAKGRQGREISSRGD